MAVEPITITEQGLTAEELAVLDKLADAYNDFCRLGIMHGWHNQEFMHHIHDAQRIVMARAAIRAHPEVFSRVLVANAPNG